MYVEAHRRERGQCPIKRLSRIPIWHSDKGGGGSRTSWPYGAEERGAPRPYAHVPGWCVGTKYVGSPAPLVRCWGWGWHFLMKARIGPPALCAAGQPDRWRRYKRHPAGEP